METAADSDLRGCQAAAERGNAEAQYRLGAMNAEGRGVPRNDLRAYKWFLRASEQGLFDARLRLGLLHEAAGPLQSFPEAARWYRLAAEGGSALASYKLGCLYFHGCGLDRNLEQAFRYLMQAANQGLPTEKPLRDAYSDEEAETLYRFGAERGSAAAQFHLAVLYELDDCPMQNVAEATKWFRSAAEQGHADAQFRLACVRANYAPVDYVEALYWCRKAAQAGVAAAQFTLGRVYERGEHGENVDFVEARKWYILAANQGNEEASASLANVTARETVELPVRVAAPAKARRTCS